MGYRVYKYDIDPDRVTDTITVSMTKGAQVLSVGIQESGLFKMWALVNTDEQEVEDRHFMVKGTGHGIYAQAEDLKFIGTIHMSYFVFHVFELL